MSKFIPYNEILNNELISKIQQIINAHQVEFGYKPYVVQVPILNTITVDGVQIKFYNGKEYFSADAENHILHHKFLDK